MPYEYNNFGGSLVSDFRKLTSRATQEYACRLVEFDTSVICRVFMHCLGSFLLHDMLLSLLEFAFEGQNMKFTVNILKLGPAVMRGVNRSTDRRIWLIF